jgi:methionyl-tRNA formyltransferase
MSTRVVFAGSPEVAVPYLRALYDAQFDIRAVITRADSRQGRKGILTPTAVARAATELDVPVIKANSLREVEIPEVDIGVVVAYGGLVPPRLLSEPTHGWTNVHFSVLPNYRGAAPVQRALWDGESTTGISIFRLVTEMDAGPVYFSRSIPFDDAETSSDALIRIAGSTTDELVATLRLVVTDAITPTEQTGDPSFAPKMTREDGRVDWSLNASTIIARIRAVTVEPGAFTTVNGESVSIGRVASDIGSAVPRGEIVANAGRVFVGTGGDSVELLEVKPAGKTMMPAADWVRGHRSSLVCE